MNKSYLRHKPLMAAMAVIVITAIVLGFTVTNIKAATAPGYIRKSNGAIINFSSLSDLVEDVEDREGEAFSIEMTGDWNEDIRLVIPEDAIVTLYMNGHIFNRGLAAKSKGWTSDGECIYIDENASLTIYGGAATSHAGVPVFNSEGSIDGSTATLTGGVIAGGSSTNGGGGIHMKEGSSLIMNSVTIAGCRAEESWFSGGWGGGIRADNASISITMNDSLITGCYAQNGGGGIYQNDVNYCTISMNRSTIQNCYALEEGGSGIYVDGEHVKIIGDGESYVKGCSAPKEAGSTIYINDDNNTVKGLIIENNTSGAITLNGSNNTVEKLIIRNNTRKLESAGIYVKKNNTHIIDCEVTSNQRVTFANAFMTTCYVSAGITIGSVAEDVYIEGKTIVKNNTWKYEGWGTYDGNLELGPGSRVNFNLSPGSDVHISYLSDPQVTKGETFRLNKESCDVSALRYLTADCNRHWDDGEYVIKYNNGVLYHTPKGSDDVDGITADDLKHEVSYYYDGWPTPEKTFKCFEDDTFAINAKTINNKTFTGWTATVDETDVTEALFGYAGLSNPDDVHLELKLPPSGTTTGSYTWPAGYSVNLYANYRNKVKEIDISSIATPVALASLPGTTAITLDDGATETTIDNQTVAWSYLTTDGETTKEISTTVAKYGSKHIATITIPETDVREFADSIDLVKNNSWPEGTTAVLTKNSGDGSVTIKVTFPETESGPAIIPETAILTILVYDSNDLTTPVSDRQTSFINPTQIVEKGTTVTVTAPDVTNMVFESWLMDDSTTNTNRDIQIEVPPTSGDAITIKAIYNPIVTEVSGTVTAPEVGKALSENATLTLTTTYYTFEVHPDNVDTVTWSPADSTAKSCVEYAAVVKIKPENQSIKVRIAGSGGNYTSCPLDRLVYSDNLTAKFNGSAANSYDTAPLSISGKFDAIRGELQEIKTPAPVEVENAADATKDALPQTVNIILKDGTDMEAAVTWSDVVQDQDDPGKFTAAGTVTLPDTVDNPDSVSLALTGIINVPSLHQHTTEKVEAKAATCTEDGNKEYYVCTGCTKKFKDANATEPIDNPSEIIIAGSHDWGSPSYVWSGDNSTVTATCVCKNDDSHEKTETVNTTSEITSKPTCEEKGKTTYTATFENPAFTKQTKDVTADALGHKWSAWKETKAPTADTEGEETRTCSVCGKTQTRTTSTDSDDPGDIITYFNTEGGGRTWTKGSGVYLNFVFKRSSNDSDTYSHFTGIMIDNTEVAESNYNSRSGSVIIDLKPEYLETLALGEHTFTASFDDGESAEVKFTIVSPNGSGNNDSNKNQDGSKADGGRGPRTGDNSHIFIMLILMMVSIVGIITSISIKKRKAK